MIEQTYNDIVTPELSEGAILNLEWDGFKEDYLCLWCLIKKYRPKSFFECGTNFGTGTNIIKSAIGKDAIVFSLDLPTELIHHSLQPTPDKKYDRVGINCKLPFVQLRGDSMTFNFAHYRCEGYYIDDNHIYDTVFRETTEILKLKPLIIIYHDSNILEVLNAIVDSMNSEYELYRVIETRVSYLLKK